MHRPLVSRTAWSRSWIFAVLSAVAMVAAANVEKDPLLHQLQCLWQPALLILWLCVGSSLIDWAYAAAQHFERQAAALMEGCPRRAIWAQQPKRLRAPTVWYVVTIFVTAGLTIVWLVRAPIHWKVCWTILVGSTDLPGDFRTP